MFDVRNPDCYCFGLEHLLLGFAPTNPALEKAIRIWDICFMKGKIVVNQL
jgi:hypothetical protein